MAAPSLGEAIALQGRNQGAEKLGNLVYQAAEADKNRKLKGQLAGAKAKKEEDDLAYKLFKDKEGYHRLVQPKVSNLLKETMNKLSEDRLNGSPYASNTRDQMIQDAYIKMGEYKMMSDGFKTFDKQVGVLGKGNYFVDPSVEDFITKYYTKSGDYEDMFNKVKKDNFQGGGGLNIADGGFVEFNPDMKINYTNDLVARTKALKPTVAGKDMVSLMYDKKQYEKTMVVPYKIADSENAFTNNPTMYNGIRPQSVEDETVSYMLQNPKAMDQFVSTSRLNVQRDPQTGMYNDTDFNIVKNKMMEISKRFTNPEVKEKIISKPSTGVVVNMAEEALKPAAPTKGLVTSNYGTPGTTMDDGDPSLTRNPTGEDQKTDVKASYFSSYNIGNIKYSTTGNNKLITSMGNDTRGGHKDLEIVAVETFPFYKGPSMSPRILRDDLMGKATLAGVKPFVHLKDGDDDYYMPLENVSTNTFSSSKFKASVNNMYLQQMIKDANDATEQIKKKFPGKADTKDIFKFIETLYNKNGTKH
jgi:hypothetical protein